MPTKIARAIRVPETDNGQQGEFIAVKYNTMQRHIRDQGWLKEKVDLLIEQKITGGHALEVGIGPGYLGLEWLKKVEGEGNLTGIDISPEMVDLAKINSQEYGQENNSEYILCDALKMPFDDNSFDCVFSYGSLHEWRDPIMVFAEIQRVLRPGGRYCIIDLRRDLDRQSLAFMRINIDMELRKGLINSVRSSYTCAEIKKMFTGSTFENSEIFNVPLALCISGNKYLED